MKYGACEPLSLPVKAQPNTITHTSAKTNLKTLKVNSTSFMAPAWFVRLHFDGTQLRRFRALINELASVAEESSNAISKVRGVRP
jgi:hypothetical protein